MVDKKRNDIQKKYRFNTAVREPVIVPRRIFDKYSAIYDFNNGYAQVKRQDGSSTFIDTDFNELDISFKRSENASSHIKKLTYYDDTQGYFNKQSKKFSKKYKGAYIFNDGMGRVKIAENIYSYVDENLKQMDKNFIEINGFKDGRARVKLLNKKYCYIDKAGNNLSQEYRDLKDFYNNIAKATKGNGHTVYLDENFKEHKTKTAAYVNNDRQMHPVYFPIDETQPKLNYNIVHMSKKFEPFRNGLARAITPDGLYTFFDSNFKGFPDDYKKAELFKTNGAAFVTFTDGTFGYINQIGKEITPRYIQVDKGKNYKIGKLKNGMYEYIFPNLEKPKAQYKNAGLFSGGTARVQFKDYSWALIDVDENLVTEKFKYITRLGDSIILDDDSMVFLKSDGSVKERYRNVEKKTDTYGAEYYALTFSNLDFWSNRFGRREKDEKKFNNTVDLLIKDPHLVDKFDKFWFVEEDKKQIIDKNIRKCFKNAIYNNEYIAGYDNPQEYVDQMKEYTDKVIKIKQKDAKIELEKLSYTAEFENAEFDYKNAKEAIKEYKQEHIER